MSSEILAALKANREEDERLNNVVPNKERSQYERDYDRLIHSRALKRLSQVSQVAAIGTMNGVHNRLTHTLQVAQVARGIGRRLKLEFADIFVTLTNADIYAFEAPALIHDLGHPPFGHVGEDALSVLIQPHDDNGFEGNAQSFRVVARLESPYPNFRGLNLTRASLAGSIKYPWMRASTGKRKKKFGAYNEDKTELDWAKGASERRTVHAAVMDWADDICYAANDLADYGRAGMIPLFLLQSSITERKRFIALVRQRHKLQERTSVFTEKSIDELEDALARQMSLLGFSGEYGSNSTDETQLHQFVSNLVRKGLHAVSLHKTARNVEFRIEGNSYLIVNILKEITMQYVVHTPSMIGIRIGQDKILSQTFEVVFENMMKDQTLLPRRFLYMTDEDYQSPRAAARLTCDFIASMTEQELIGFHRRVTGADLGTVLDSIAR